MIHTPQILTRLDQERRNLSRDEEILEILPNVTRLHASDNTHHSVIYSSLTADNAEATIVQEIEFHRRLGVSFEWKLYAHDRPSDLLGRLERKGFQIGPREAVLVLALSQPGNRIEETDTLPVVRVAHRDHVVAFRRVAEEVFGKDYAFTATQLAEAIQSGSSQHRGYIAYVGDEPASIGRLYTHPNSHFGGLYGGGTRRAFRGRGLYRAVVAARARDAAAQGARYLLADALPTSRPILERMGFERLTDTWPCEWTPRS